MKQVSRDVICGECNEIIDEHTIYVRDGDAESTLKDQAEGNYFQWHARDAMNAHIRESEKKHSGSTSEISFGEWKEP